MGFNPRKLRHRIDIEQKSLRQDPQTGGNKESWSVLYADVPAEIAPASVREFVASQAMQSGITTRITIRYHGGLNASMRIVHLATGRVYNPQGWLSDTDSGIEYLTAPCTEGVNEG